MIRDPRRLSRRGRRTPPLAPIPTAPAPSCHDLVRQIRAACDDVLARLDGPGWRPGHEWDTARLLDAALSVVQEAALPPEEET